MAQAEGRLGESQDALRPAVAALLCRHALQRLAGLLGLETSEAILPAWARKSPKIAEVLPLLYLHGWAYLARA